MIDALRAALDGVRVVALATNIPGPLAAARLCAMGASVTKIEPPHGDALESSAPAWYGEIVAGMQVLRLDLRDNGGRGVLQERLRDADVLLTTTRTGALARLGLAWNELHVAHPRLVHVAIVGEGAPHGDRAGHDLTYQARAGLLSPPAMPRTVAADLAAAERATSSVLAALVLQERTGEGVRIDVAIVDAATELAAPFHHGLTAPSGALGGALATYDMYRAREGWVACAALEPHFAERLRAMLGVTALDAATLRNAFAGRTALEWERLAQECDVPLAAVAGAGARS